MSGRRPQEEANLELKTRRVEHVSRSFRDESDVLALHTSKYVLEELGGKDVENAEQLPITRLRHCTANVVQDNDVVSYKINQHLHLLFRSVIHFDVGTVERFSTTLFFYRRYLKKKRHNQRF